MPKQMGYLFVDHRASPGLPEDVAIWAGYDPKLSGEGKIYECDTMGCSHCGGHVVPNKFRTRARAKCFECDNREGHYICDACDFLRCQTGYVHTPLAKVVDRVRNQEQVDAANTITIGNPLLLRSGE
jgi:hypothetical protein